MANPVTPVKGTTAVDHASETQKTPQTPAKPSPFPNDTVTLSNTSKPALASNQTAADVSRDGDNH